MAAEVNHDRQHHQVENPTRPLQIARYAHSNELFSLISFRKFLTRCNLKMLFVSIPEDSWRENMFERLPCKGELTSDNVDFSLHLFPPHIEGFNF